LVAPWWVQRFFPGMEVRPSASPADTNADTTRLRHARLRERRLLDAGPDSSFDDLAHLAALIGGTSRASVNLLDDRECRPLAWYGPRPPAHPLALSHCALTLAAPDVCVMPDASGLPEAGRGDPAARFYAAAAIRDFDGVPLGTVCVTDPAPRPGGLAPAQAEALRRLARQAMTLIDARNMEAYRLAFRHAAVDLVLIEVLAGGRYVLADLNETHMANTGLRPETFIGRTPEEALPPGTAAFSVAKYAECVRTGAVVKYEQTAEFPTGPRLRRSFMTPLRNRGGEVDRILLTSIDQTEMLSIQAKLRQSQTLEAMGQLAGGLAHDFNNLLAAIIGNLELLSTRLTDPRLRQRVETALRAAERGGRLTRQLLDLRRPAKAPAVTGIDPNTVVEGMLDLLRRSLGGMILVEADLAPSPWAVAAEASQLEQAILNLAINARDAMADGGTLTIATRNLPAGDPDEPDELPAGDFVVISVTDQGSGMPPEVLERAMEPFFTTKPPGKGSGLGLAQVYGFARQFGGTARIDSAPGRGTRVALLLPRGVQGDAVAGHAPDPVRAARPARILVVEDEPDVRQATVDTLLSFGHAASGAASAAVALSMLAAEPADLLLVDHAMPGMSGVELIRQVRQTYPKMRTLLMTGNADAVLRHDDIAERSVVHKPFGMKTLQHAVDAALAQL
jgi:signal transduction histidine kinase